MNKQQIDKAARIERLRRVRPRFSPDRRLSAEPSRPTTAAVALPPIEVMSYGPDGFEETRAGQVEEAHQLVGRRRVTWINVNGLGDAAFLAQLGEVFGLHWLALKAVAQTDQRAKFEEYGELLFVVARMVAWNGRLETEQLSIFLGRDFVLTIQERPGDCLERVREQIREGLGRIRQAGPGYLVYALLNATIGNYFPVLEAIDERLDGLEEEVIVRPGAEVARQLHLVKAALLQLRRAAWPHREVVSRLARDEIPLLTDEVRLYLRDCYEETVQLIDLLENYREIASGLMDVYLSNVSNKTNEIMKLLTIFTAVFAPLAFITGLYGMNFNTAFGLNMPELNWPWGYPFALCLMAASVVGMLHYFRRRGWW